LQRTGEKRTKIFKKKKIAIKKNARRKAFSIQNRSPPGRGATISGETAEKQKIKGKIFFGGGGVLLGGGGGNNISLGARERRKGGKGY